MTGRDYHLANSLPCPQYHSNAATPVGKGNAGPPVTGDFGVMADQDALGTSDRGNSQEESQMACEPHEPRMCQALPVAHDQIWNPCQSAKGSQKWGQLSKAQETRDIGKVESAPGPGGFLNLKAGP